MTPILPPRPAEALSPRLCLPSVAGRFPGADSETDTQREVYRGMFLGLRLWRKRRQQMREKWAVIQS